MNAQQRREEIKKILFEKHAPVSASALAELLGVSRQIIVGDIALMRASGLDVLATSRGYLVSDRQKKHFTLACNHTAAQTREELYAIVDNGCTVLDVIVEHPIYGQITGVLQLASRYDVDAFLERLSCPGTRPLSSLTEGIHLHTISCPDEQVFTRLKQQLKQAHILLSE